MTERIKSSNHKSSRKTSTRGYLYKSCSEEMYNRFRKREGREMDKEDEKGVGGWARGPSADQPQILGRR